MAGVAALLAQDSHVQPAYMMGARDIGDRCGGPMRP